MNSLGQILKEERKRKGLSQIELAKVLNTTQDTISLWELDKRKPQADDIILICQFFEISADYLLGLELLDGRKIYNITNNFY